MILVLWSNGPAIYEEPLDRICDSLILVQRSKDPTLFERSLDKIRKSFYMVIYWISQPGVSIWLSSYWISQAGVEEPELTFITAWPHKHPGFGLRV